MSKHTPQNCPVARVAQLLSDTWTMLIIRDLLRVDMRFSELEESLDGISSRTLTAKLKTLESEGVITKKGLLYSLTKQGAKLGVIIDAMSAYGKRYMKD